jgi:2-polyprenyl-6-methoxyphenol hydroxylase-like FAD-dependent oxidoreductase
MKEASEVVIVGGGIAGGSLAFALARDGLDVTVLEQTLEYPDRVRGENILPWGVKEARALGVDKVLLDAGAQVAPTWREYAEGVGQVAEIALSEMVEGIPGTLKLRHPDACEALMAAASLHGAKIVRGARNLRVIPGRPVGVSYDCGTEHSVSTSLVVGADGRASSVRRQAGITLLRQQPICFTSGLLIDGLEELPNDFDVIALEGDLFLALFHLGGGRARVYLFHGFSGRRRFAGHQAGRRFLDACDLSCLPWGCAVADGTAAGPCATYPGDDTWTETPYAEGIVLVGDSAGYNDPVQGQGLAIGLRDVRIVRDLVLSGARNPRDFAPYGDERSKRMERLRFVADIIAVARVEDADNRAARRACFDQAVAARDPDLLPLLRSSFAGPETIPPELLRPALIERFRRA